MYEKLAGITGHGGDPSRRVHRHLQSRSAESPQPAWSTGVERRLTRVYRTGARSTFGRRSLKDWQGPRPPVLVAHLDREVRCSWPKCCEGRAGSSTISPIRRIFRAPSAMTAPPRPRSGRILTARYHEQGEAYITSASRSAGRDPRSLTNIAGRRQLFQLGGNPTCAYRYELLPRPRAKPASRDPRAGRPGWEGKRRSRRAVSSFACTERPGRRATTDSAARRSAGGRSPRFDSSSFASK